MLISSFGILVKMRKRTWPLNWRLSYPHSEEKLVHHKKKLLRLLVFHDKYRDYWENGNYTFSRNENPELVYVRARDIEGVYLSDRELGNPEGFWTRNGREGWSRENILRRASHIQDVRQNTESGMSLDELSQNPVLDDTIRSYYNNPVQVAQVGSYYVFQSDGRHRTLAAQSLDTYIPVLVTGSYTRND